MNNKDRTRKRFSQLNMTKLEVVLAVIAFFQILYCIYVNFAGMMNMVDYDSSSALVHAREIWRQKTLLLSNYGYMTTIDLDSIAPVVAVLYGITNNLLFAQACANSIMILLYVYVIHCICRNLTNSKFSEFLVIVLILIPYSIGQLGYFTMLFCSGAFYTVRLLLPLMLISIVFDLDSGRKLKDIIMRSTLLLVWGFFSGLSSGVYVLLCGFLPILAFELFYTIFYGKKYFKTNRFYIEITTFLVTLIGVASEKVFQLSTKASEMVLVNNTNWLHNIGSYFVGIYELFGGVAYGETKLFSIQGITVLAFWFVVSCILFGALIFSVKKIKSVSLSYEHGVLISLFVVNFFVLTLLYTTYGGGTFEYRYHLLPMVPMIFLVPLMIEWIRESGNQFVKNAIEIVIVLMVAIVLLLGDLKLSVYLKPGANSWIKEMADEFDDRNYDTVVIVGESHAIMGRQMRAFANKSDIICVNEDLQNYAHTTWGGSYRGLDNADQSRETVAIVTTKEIFGDLPQYIQDRFSWIEDLNGFSIYTSNESPLDFADGIFAQEERYIDFPYSPNYVVGENSKIKDNGKLQSDGKQGVVLSSRVYELPEGKWSYKINYKVVASEESDCGKVSLKNENGEELVSKEIVDSGTNLYIEIESIKQRPQYLCLEIFANEGAILEIESVEMTKMTGK